MRDPQPSAPCPLLSSTGPARRAAEEKRGARAREGPLPVAATHLVAEHSWGGGKGAGRGVGGGRERSADSPGCSARAGLPPARDPWPPPYAGACVGTCAGAPRAGRALLRRRLRGDRFGVWLPSMRGGKEIPRRNTAHAQAVGNGPQILSQGFCLWADRGSLAACFESRGSRHCLGGEKPCECHMMCLS